MTSSAIEARHPFRDYLTADYWHRSEGTEAGPAYKEWCHFCVMQGDLELLVNFSCLGTRSGVRTAPRLTVLVRSRDGSWDGDVEEFNAELNAPEPGQFSATFGANRMWLDETGYHLRCRLARRDVTLSLDLTPMVQPVVANTVRLSPDEAIRWMVVPHLRATGTVAVDGNVQQVADAPAYHDRNWGRFSWGGSYAWEWATIVPDDADAGWCLVYSRISDRARTGTRSQSLILWRDALPSRKFFGRDLEVALQGRLRPAQVLQVPRMMALVLSPSAPDVPRHMQIAAKGFGADVNVHLDFESFAHIGVPNDVGIGLSTLCEIGGRARVSGQVGSETLAFEGRVQMEINSAEP